MIRIKNLIGVLGIAALIAGLPGVGMCEPAATPAVGNRMPAMHLAPPASPQDCNYLGVEAGRPFQLSDAAAQLILVEIIGVYCPLCHQQRPHINRLYHRIQQDARLARKVKLIGIAVGATPMEAAYLVKEARIPYPVIADEAFDVHKRLGEPRTPFNILTTGDGEVLWSHLGIIEDMNALYTLLESLAGP